MTDEVKMIRDIYKMIGEETNSDTVRELVSKYKQLQQEKEELIKYKNAWEELYSEREKPCGIEYMQDLEEKYGIEVE